MEAVLESPVQTTPAADSPRNTRTVAEWVVPRAQAIVEKANKRAAKLGVPGFALTIGESRLVIISHPDAVTPVYERHVDITIEGPVIKAPGGWALAGRVDFEDGLTLVSAKPGVTLPASLRTTTPFCDHCQTLRGRHSVFAFLREGEHIQVGRNCMKDFLGTSPEAALWSLSAFGGILDDIDEEREGGGGRAQYCLMIERVLAATVCAVEINGWTSAATARERNEAGECINSTANDVTELLLGKPYQGKPVITEAHAARAAEILAWAKERFVGAAAQSEYEWNLAELLQHDEVRVRRISLICSLFAAHRRATEAAAERADRVNAHVGTIGERRDFDCVFAGESSYETAYGVTYIGRFQTAEGLVVYKGNTPFWPAGMKPGEAIRFKATIKDHGDYKGALQTLVSRAKLAS